MICNEFYYGPSMSGGMTHQLPHVKVSKTVLDSGFYAVDSGFYKVTGFQSLSVKHGFWIPGSLSCIPYSKAQDSGSHKQNFP